MLDRALVGDEILVSATITDDAGAAVTPSGATISARNATTGATKTASPTIAGSSVRGFLVLDSAGEWWVRLAVTGPRARSKEWRVTVTAPIA